MTDARSLYAQFTYNNRGLLTDVDYSDTTPDVHYAYGEYGERTLMQEKNSSGTEIARTDYSYDTYKRLQTETRTFNGLSGTYSVGYTYNYANALKQISYTVNSWSKSVNYDYNYAGAPSKVGTNLISLTGFDTTNNVVSALDYRAWGALQRADYGNGRRLALGYNQKRSQMGNLKLRKTDDTDVVTNLSYDYYSGGGGSGGNNGRVRFITDSLDGNYSLDISYDDHNRLTAYGNYRSYTYDEWNNLKSVSSTNGVGEAPSYTLTYSNNASGAPSTNRIANTGYTFDSAGNLTNDNSLSYTYDAASRMKTAGSDSYEYDGDGHRVKQHVSGYSNSVFYLWSSVLNEPVVEVDSATPSVFRAHVYGPGGQMLALQSYDGNFYWLHADALGNGRKMTNTSGSVIYRAEYDPHGQMLYEWQTSGYTYLNSHKFRGYERDWSTNLDNAKARTFNHNKGRFMQPDPMGLGAANASDPQSLNLYSYVGNDPMNFVDPSGMNLIAPDYWERVAAESPINGYGNGFMSPGIHSWGYWGGNTSMTVEGQTYYFPADYYSVTMVVGGFGSWFVGVGGDSGSVGGGQGTVQTLQGQQGGKLTKEQCDTLRTLIQRQEKYGFPKTARMSGNTFGDHLLEPFNSSFKPHIQTEFGPLDLDWFTDISGYSAGFQSVVYPIAKLGWSTMRTLTGILPANQPLPWQDPGERTAYYYSMLGWTYKDFFDDKFFKTYCSQ